MALNKNQRRISSLPHDVYRAYDADGTLLYVGCSVNALKRMREHKIYSEWWGDARSGDIRRYPTRRHALSVEQRAVLSEAPIWNKVLERHWINPDYESSACFEMDSLFWENGEVWIDGEG